MSAQPAPARAPAAFPAPEEWAEVYAVELAERTAEALRDLGGTVHDLEEQLLRGIVHLQADTATLDALQSVDLLSQTLAQLDELMRRFAATLPADLAVDGAALLTPIKLAALRARLSGEMVAPDAQTSDQKGDVALF